MNRRWVDPEKPPSRKGNVVELWAQHCIRKRDGLIDANNAENLRIVLDSARDWRGVLGFDEFGQRPMILRELPKPPHDNVSWGAIPRPLLDADVHRALAWFHRHEFIGLKDGLLWAAMVTHAREHTFHPVKQYFAKVTAGCAPRMTASNVNAHLVNPDLPTNVDALSLMLTLGFGAEDTLLNRKLSRTFVTAMVRRVRDPGCQHDHMLVLIGEQGQRKSSGLRELVGSNWFTDHLPHISSKDALIQLHGKILIEWSEMDAMKRSSSIEATKAFISSRVDTLRPPYGRVTVDIPRSCSFAGTANRDDLIADATGARRFWPVETGTVDSEWIVANRDLIWRLACEAEEAGEAIWVIEPELQQELGERQSDIQWSDDPWAERVIRHAHDGMVLTGDWLWQVIGVRIEEQSGGDMKRVGEILRKAGFKRGPQVREGGHRVRRWHKVAKS